MRGVVWLVLLAILLVLAIVGQIRSPPTRKVATADIPPDPNTIATLEPGVAPTTRLFILLHGYAPSEGRMAAVADLLKQRGDVLRIAYPANGGSNVATETLAKYPNVDSSHIQFFGHSNGAYLLTKALEEYSSMRINRVVFAGSVVPKDYDWRSIMEKKIPRVEQVRNYVGTQDWVVALFPRLFELRPFLWLKNELGSSGFGGFDAGGGCNSNKIPVLKSVTNVCYVQGEHSAFEDRVTEIVDFLLATTPADAVQVQRPFLGWVLDSKVTVWLTWLAIMSLVVWIGFRVVLAAPSPNWVVLVLFALLVLRTLQTV
jgi:hypothetical protein